MPMLALRRVPPFGEPPWPREVRSRVRDRSREASCAERRHLDLHRSRDGWLAVAKRADVSLSARERGQLGSRRVERARQARRVFSADAERYEGAAIAQDRFMQSSLGYLSDELMAQHD